MRTETQRKTERDEAEELTLIEGRNAVTEALRADRTIDRIYLLEGAAERGLMRLAEEAGKRQIPVRVVKKERLDRMSPTGHHQGVIAQTAAFTYGTVEEMLAAAEKAGEPPFLILLDGIEDPHNLGAILRSANLAGAHGVIIPKNRAVGLTPAAVKASAGAVNYTPVARVTNLTAAMEELKKKGLWFVCAAMDGEPYYRKDLRGPIGLVIGNEGSGVSRPVRAACDFTVSVPMKGDIDSLNASVAAGILAFEILRQRSAKQ